jgi:hypothetical protein
MPLDVTVDDVGSLEAVSDADAGSVLVSSSEALVSTPKYDNPNKWQEAGFGLSL